MPNGVGVPYVLTVHAMVVIPITLLGIVFLRWAFPRAFSLRRWQEPQQEQPVKEAYKEA